jgi:hypothetical protein
MKTLKTISKALILLLLVAITYSSNAQTPVYSCVTRNAKLVKPNVYQFDIYIYPAAEATKALPMNNYQLAFSIENTNQVANYGTFTAAYITGSSQLTGFLPKNVVTLFIREKWILRINGPFASSLGMDIPRSGLRMGTFQLTNTVDYAKKNIDMQWLDTPPYYTRVFAIENGKPTQVPITHEEISSGITNVVTSDAEVLCFPNPFSDQTKIQFTLPEDSHALLDVYDITGKFIKNLFNANATKEQTYTVVFNGEALATGVYMYKLTTDKGIATGKMTYTKN